MIFERELADKVMAGDKTVTRRLCSDNPRSPWWREKCALAPGKVVTVNPGRGVVNIGRIEVVSARRMLLREGFGVWPDREAQLEGFETFEKFRRAWPEINGEWDPEALVWRVEFKVAAGIEPPALRGLRPGQVYG